MTASLITAITIAGFKFFSNINYINENMLTVNHVESIIRAIPESVIDPSTKNTLQQLLNGEDVTTK